jgi:superfamily II DNA/RNA helicase
MKVTSDSSKAAASDPFRRLSSNPMNGLYANVMAEAKTAVAGDNPKIKKQITAKGPESPKGDTQSSKSSADKASDKQARPTAKSVVKNPHRSNPYLKPDKRQDRRSSSIDSRSSSCCYIRTDRSFDMQIENGRAPTTVHSWEAMLQLAPNENVQDGFGQTLQWCGWKDPNVLQQRSIPAFWSAVTGRNLPEGRKFHMTIVQAEKGIGKSSSVLIAALTALQPRGRLQAVILAMSSTEALRKQYEELGVLTDVKVVFVEEGSSDTGDADVIVGTPNAVLDTLAEPQYLEEAKLLVLDDAKELVEGNYVDHICKIDRILDQAAVAPVRYIVLSTFMERTAKRMLRAIKSSLMNKKNMMDIKEHVARLKKSVKHYVVEGRPQDWVKFLQNLEKAMWFPKATVFCDGLDNVTLRGLIEDLKAGERLHNMTFVTYLGTSETAEEIQEREEAVRKFNRGEARLFITTSHSSIFQLALPSVYWVVHFDVPDQNTDLYGARLLSLDQRLRSGKGSEHGVSVMFTEKREKLREIESTYAIEFVDLPFF